MFKMLLKGLAVIATIATTFASPSMTEQGNDFEISYAQEPYYQELIKQQPINYESLKTIQQQNADIQRRKELGQNVCNVLEFSGVGAYAGLTVGLGSKLRQQGYLNKTYDTTAGSSGAALNAMIPGKIENLDKAFYVMRGFWSSLKNKYVFVNESSGFEQNWGAYNNAPFQQTILNLDKLTGPTYYRDSFVDVTNMNYMAANTYNLKEYSTMEQVLVAASMNFPIYFQKMTINGDYVMDGSLFGFTMFETVTGNKNCDYYNFDVITYSNSNHKLEITAFGDYIRSIFNVGIGNFMDELEDIMDNTCSQPKGVINVYNLDNVSHHHQIEKVFDFSNTTGIITTGITNPFTVKTYPLC